VRWSGLADDVAAVQGDLGGLRHQLALADLADVAEDVGGDISEGVGPAGGLLELDGRKPLAPRLDGGQLFEREVLLQHRRLEDRSLRHLIEPLEKVVIGNREDRLEAP
jgi:hypothetical protein